MTQSLLSRRRMLTLGAASVLPWLAGCGTATIGQATKNPEAPKAALLLPLSGDLAAVGQNMARAATLAGAELPVYDTTDTAEGAAAAATEAIAKGAKLLLGPLRSDQTPAVLAVAKRIPVISFSNDESLADQGAFVVGLTPAQSVGTMFTYARAQGLTRIAVVVAEGPFGAASIAAAERVAAAGGIMLTAVLTRDPGAGGLMKAVAARGDKPQAVYLADGGAALSGFAAGLAGSGVQVMGSVQWGAGNIAADDNLAGAWFTAPPPDLFMPFAERFEAAHGEAPGLVAGLGHDAALLANGLANARALTPKGITRKAGFTGVLGPFRFMPDGRCQRDLAVLTLRGGAIEVLAEVSGT
ncbi:MAG: penicillin-binding protein activator [Paracoccaceae bacterium]